MKTAFLMTLLTLLFVFVGRILGGQQGMVMAFGFAIVMNFFSYWFSHKIVLAMYHAKEVTESEAPELHSIVRNLATSAGLPMPKVYIIPGDTPNAFATGRNPQHGVVAVTEGILRILNRDEISGVLAHELSHVKHRDILIGTIAATFAGAIGMLAHMAQWGMMFGGSRHSNDDDRGGNPIVMILMLILAPIGAMLIQMAVSRSREFEADAGAARLTHNPMALASALQKLERGAQILPMNAKPATAHMFIVNPLTGSGMMSLFRTHPPTQDRIARLEAMARGGLQSAA